ncbi:hypothetical protein ACSQ67_026386 [Phaseolus vulgaris]
MSSQCHGVHFLKVFAEHNLQRGIMVIKVPTSFVSRHWEGMSNPVILSLPNGSKNKVFWVNKDGDVWFCNGWKEFAKYSKLDVSHIIVFRYEGNSCFNVIIFGKSDLEIEYPLSRDATDEKVEEIDEDVYTPFANPKDHELSRSCQRNLVYYIDTRKEMLLHFLLNMAELGRFRQSEPFLFKVTIYPLEENSSTSLFKGQKGVSICLLHPLIHPLKQGHQSLEMISLSSSRLRLYINDICNVLMQTIPFRYAKSYLEKSGRHVSLSVGDRWWEVKLLFFDRNCLARFSDGWFEFVKDCDLKEGDLCVLRMLDEENLVFNVSFFQRKKSKQQL